MKTKQVLIGLFFCVLVSSCQIFAPSALTATPSLVPIATPSSFPFLTQTNDWLPGNTPMPIKTYRPNTTLYPTLEPTRASILLMDALIKPTCELPCWWGVIPGQTTAEDAQYLFFQNAGVVTHHEQAISERHQWDLSSAVSVGKRPSETGQFELEILLADFLLPIRNDGVVDQVLGTLYVSRYEGLHEKNELALDVKQVLLQYGLPDYFLVEHFFDLPLPPHSADTQLYSDYMIVVVYNQRHFVLKYWGKAPYSQGTEKRHICLQLEQQQVEQVKFALMPAGETYPMIREQLAPLLGQTDAELYEQLIQGGDDACFDLYMWKD